MGCEVQKAGETEKGVDQEAAQLLLRPREIQLKRAIDETDREPEVFEKVVHADSHGFGNHLAVSLRHRFEHPEIELVVEVVHASVEGFQRIGDGGLFLLLHIFEIFEIGDIPEFVGRLGFRCDGRLRRSRNRRGRRGKDGLLFGGKWRHFRRRSDGGIGAVCASRGKRNQQ